MKHPVLLWPRRRRSLLLRQLAVLACALALGLGYSHWSADAYLPSIDGNIYSMLALEDSLLVVLARGNRNSLVRIDHSGALLNYMTTAGGQAFQYLESDGETVYALLSRREGENTLQRLVSLSLADTAMRARPLAELTALSGAPAGVVWRELYLPEPDGEDRTLTLSGLDGQGQGWLARADPDTGRVSFEAILPGESILFLKYVAPDHYVWINRRRAARQSTAGRKSRQR